MSRPTGARFEVVLFDLDGTLSDSAPGILASLRRAFEINGIAPLSPQVERSLLGPPFYESLPPLIGADRLPDVLAAYRAHYAAGSMYDTTVYPGVPDLLGGLAAAGMRMAVATSKPEEHARLIVERLGLLGYVETVGGDTLDAARPTKAAVIGEVLHRLGDPGRDVTIMVGDRSHDVLGARAHSLRCAGAAWGYGAPGELADAGADPVCADAAELASWLAGPLATGAGTDEAAGDAAAQ